MESAPGAQEAAPPGESEVGALALERLDRFLPSLDPSPAPVG